MKSWGTSSLSSVPVWAESHIHTETSSCVRGHWSHWFRCVRGHWSHWFSCVRGHWSHSFSRLVLVQNQVLSSCEHLSLYDVWTPSNWLTRDMSEWFPSMHQCGDREGIDTAVLSSLFTCNVWCHQLMCDVIRRLKAPAAARLTVWWTVCLTLCEESSVPAEDTGVHVSVKSQWTSVSESVYMSLSAPSNFNELWAGSGSKWGTPSAEQQAASSSRRLTLSCSNSHTQPLKD